MPGDIDQIKARLDIVDIVSEFVQLKQAGTNWKGLCPFHSEKSPSFMVSKDKQIWHCFGCGEGGDIFSFIQKIEGLEFGESLRLLAQKAGVILTQQNPQINSQKNQLLDICELASNYWHHILTETPHGQKARDYLQERQVSEKTITDFKLGYAPESWELLSGFLQKKGFQPNDIFLAGLTVKKERGQGFYDRFRDRLMFPIRDVHGHTVGFTGRTLNPNEKGGKYVNTPQTQIYNKSVILYNLDQAKQTIKKEDRAIVVEGQMDVLAAAQAGTGNVVAVSGTAFTLEQLTLLKRYTSNIAIAFDTDPAGESASKRGIDLALSQDMNVNMISLPQGKDPDECIKANQQDWFNALAKTQSVMEYYFSQVQARFDVTQPQAKKQAGAILLGVIAKISSKIEQTHWLQRLSDLLRVPEQILRDSLAPAERQPTTGRSAVSLPPPAERTRNSRLSEQLLAICLTHPAQLETVLGSVSEENIAEGELRQLYKQLSLYYTKDSKLSAKNFDYQTFLATITAPSLTQLAETLTLLAEKDFFDFSSDAISAEISQLITFLKKDYLSTQLKALESKIKAAENDKRHQDIEALSHQVGDIIYQLKLLE